MLPVYKAVDPQSPGGPAANLASMLADPARWFGRADTTFWVARKLTGPLVEVRRVGHLVSTKAEANALAKKARYNWERAARQLLTGVVLLRVYAGR